MQLPARRIAGGAGGDEMSTPEQLEALNSVLLMVGNDYSDVLLPAATQIADLTAKLAECELERDGLSRGILAMGAATDELRAAVARLKEQNGNVTGNYLTLLAEPCIYCGQAEYEKKDAEARLRELREALTTIKEIVSDKFLDKHEKLEVIESRCDISLCNEALAKSHD
jgi:hypothetical protein